MQDLSGQSIKGYDLRELIGAGGFGAVYRAYQPLIKRDVAMKIILPDYASQPDFIRRFEVEAQLVARLEHLHIVALYDYWRDPHGAYLVMRWLRGGSLRQRLKRGAIDNEVAVQIVEQVASALAAAHRRGVVHRDIKPDNILFDEDGNAYLADFGIAKDVREAVDEEAVRKQETGESALTGSPFYLAPEQAQNQPVSPQTDLYSLGIVMYEILTGQPPFKGDKGLMPILLQHINDPIPPVRELRPDLSDDVDAVLQHATAKQPEDRYQDANGLARDFRQAVLRTRTDHPAARAPIQIDVDAAATRDIDPSQTLDIEVPTDEFDDVLIITEPMTPSTLIIVPPAEIVNPYKGLQAFEEADASDFYGRDALIERLLDRLREPVAMSRFLAVIGPSGSGKSSVVKAGVIPALREGALRDSDEWYLTEMKPGADPFRELTAALLRVAVEPLEGLQDRLRADENALVEAVNTILAQGGVSGLVLTIDQFEEVFTQVEEEAARTQFLTLLQRAVMHRDCPFRLIITLRADFYDRPLLYPNFGELVQARSEVVLPLNTDELREAIVTPAERAGVTVESGLIAAMVAEVGEQHGSLPLLQYALTELFERREDTVMTLAAYRASGGVLGALARRAEELYSATDMTGQAALHQMFLRMVEVGDSGDDTRRRVQQAELMALTEDGDFVSSLLDQWNKARLLTFDRDPDTRMPVVTVAHEALIREWERLRTWLDDSREDLLLQRRLQQENKDWRDHERDASFLVTGLRLQQYENLIGEAALAFTPEEIEFVQASVTERDRKAAEERERQERLRRLQRTVAIVSSVAAVVALILAGIALLSYFEAEDQRAIADDERALAERKADEFNSANLATTALLAFQNDNTDKALVCALEANAIPDPPDQSQQVLFDAALAPGTERVFRGHEEGVNSGVFSPDGQTILSGSRDDTLILWDVATGEPIRRFEGHTDDVRRVDISPDGTVALSASRDGTVMLWDLATGEALATLDQHEGDVRAIAFSPDGSLALSGSEDDTVILWDIGAREPVYQYKMSEPETATDEEDPTLQDVMVVAFSPAGTSAVFGARDGSLELWDVASHELIFDLVGHTTEIGAVAFNPAGTQLVSASQEKIFLWDVATGEALADFNPGAGVSSLSFTRDGRQILSAGQDGNITLWQWDVANDLVSELDRFVGHDGFIGQIELSPDGYSLLSASNDRTLRLWNLTNGAELRRYEGQVSTINRVNVSPDGSLVMAGALDDGVIRIWDFATGDEVAVVNAPVYTWDTAFSPDGEMIVSTDFMPSRMIVWNWQTGEQLRTWEGVEEVAAFVYSVVFTPDGERLVSGVGDGSVRVWDVTSGESVATLQAYGITGALFGVAVSPDGSQVLAGGVDQFMVLWNLADGAELRRFEGFESSVDGVAFSPDGTQALAISGSVITLWDVESGTLLRQFAGHDEKVTRAVFSRDGQLIVSGSNDGTLRVWDVATGQTIRRLDHGAQVWTVDFGPDGQTVLSGSNDASVRLWDATPMTLDKIRAWMAEHRYVPDAVCLE